MLLNGCVATYTSSVKTSFCHLPLGGEGCESKFVLVYLFQAQVFIFIFNLHENLFTLSVVTNITFKNKRIFFIKKSTFTIEISVEISTDRFVVIDKNILS